MAAPQFSRQLSSSSHVLTPDTINHQVKQAEYAVRGEIVLRAMQHQTALKANKNHSLPFDEVIMCNIGNPQILGQKPLTFFRQVAALCEYPALLDHDKLMPEDARARARQLLAATVGGTGAYSASSGIPLILEDVAKFITDRDGHKSDPADIFLTDGASVAVQRMLRLVIRDHNDGILIPIPQYPLYSATIDMYGGAKVGYLLNEEAGWGLEIKELERSLQEAQKKGITTRALVVINPGNPTGSILQRKNMEEVIEFCHKNRLILMADEVYQDNIYYQDQPFISFKKVLREMGDKYSNFELASFHSVSKGFFGECGKRGGYMELVGMHPEVKSEVYKLASVSLCPNVIGQIIVDVMVNPPKQGDASYEQYISERDEIIASLKRRAALITDAFNKMEGVSCVPAAGAMYAFPKITLPQKAVDAARAAKREPDFFYCLALLDNAGVCVVPGSGFGQKEGTYHFRTTFLPPENKIQSVVDRMAVFHAKFMDQYR